MKRIILSVLFIFMIIMTVSAGQLNYKNRIIVQYKHNFSSDDINIFINKYGLKVMDEQGIIRFIESHYGIIRREVPVVEVPFYSYIVTDVSDVPEIVRKLNEESVVEYAEPDFVRSVFAGASNDPRTNEQWGYHKVSASAVYDADIIPSNLNRQIKVAVLDTGIFSTHEDLIGVTLNGYNAVDGNYDPQDNDGHGTFVSGIIAADTNNSLGIAGTAFSAGTSIVSILPVKVLDDSGDGYDSDIYAGFKWAADNGADILNCSFGGPNESLTVRNGANYAVQKGCLVIAASGNDNIAPVEDKIYPSGFANVLSVGATTPSDERADFSCYGKVDVMAPGDNILSCTITAVNDYAYSSGTSFSTPFVSGIAALIMLKENTDAVATRGRIEYTCDDIGDSGYDNETGWGRVNVLNALTYNEFQPQTMSIKTYNWPNPFSPERDVFTNITFEMERPAAVKFEIYDAAGNMIWDQSVEESGTVKGLNNIRWNGKDKKENIAANGVYFYVIKSGSSVIGKNKIAVLY